MPHGDFSDAGAIGCLVTGLTSIFAPHLWFTSFGPIKPMLNIQSPEAVLAVRFAGGLLMFMALALFAVRWNVVNGKAGALGMWLAAANTASLAFEMDGQFVPRGWYLLAAFFGLVGLHLAFNANPMLTAAMLKDKEAAKAKAK